MKRHLTKSRFKVGYDCPTKLYYLDKKEYGSNNVDNSFLEALAEGGFTTDDIKEILLQQAIYCGVPAANHAVKEANAIIAEMGLLKG